MIQDDHRLADHLALTAGEALAELKERRAGVANPWTLRDEGDLLAHQLLVKELHQHRSADIVFSEEGTEDPRRLGAERTWIIDPLDGTHDFPFRDSIEWAVHVALVDRTGSAIAAAVAVPGLDEVFATDTVTLAERPDREQPLIVSGRSNAYLALEVADSIGAQVVACGSSGVKAMLVVNGTVDAYIHSGQLWEWDVCAPAAVAQAAGLTVTDMRATTIEYNRQRPIVDGLVITRPEYAERVLSSLEAVL